MSGGGKPRAALVINLPLAKVRRWLLLIVAGITLASALSALARHLLEIPWSSVVNLFNANQEANIPTLYSSLLLVVVSLLLTAIGAWSTRNKRDRYEWFALASLFALAAVDETAGLHELLNDPLRSELGTTGPLSFPWVLVGAPLALVAAVALRGFVARLPAPVRRLAIVGGVVFVGGAIGVEMLENMLTDSEDLQPTLASLLVGTISEMCEMVGLVLLVEASLLYIALEHGSVSFAFSTGAAASSAMPADPFTSKTKP